MKGIITRTSRVRLEKAATARMESFQADWNLMVMSAEATAADVEEGRQAVSDFRLAVGVIFGHTIALTRTNQGAISWLRWAVVAARYYPEELGF